MATLITLASMMLALSAVAADYPNSTYGISRDPFGGVSGNFIWYNRSVQVGGTLSSNGGCVSVVYTAYDRNGDYVTRAARPGDNEYMCSGSKGHGFTLDAGDVYGGIRYVRVTMWCKDSGGVFNCASRLYLRP
ncbi:hypothetical protein [Streptomyces sp. NPDC045251]|uniref:hypothetical protein n=1 Tax=unclassified Streptomyces TaxID=2593676 RepID=UPI00340B22D1